MQKYCLECKRYHEPYTGSCEIPHPHFSVPVIDEVTMNRACPPNCNGNIKQEWLDEPDKSGWWWFSGKLLQENWIEASPLTVLHVKIPSGDLITVAIDGKYQEIKPALVGKWLKIQEPQEIK